MAAVALTRDQALAVYYRLLTVEERRERETWPDPCLKPVGRTYCFLPIGHAGACRPFYA